MDRDRQLRADHRHRRAAAVGQGRALVDAARLHKPRAVGARACATPVHLPSDHRRRDHDVRIAYQLIGAPALCSLTQARDARGGMAPAIAHAHARSCAP